MNDLKPCPCEKTPEKLHIIPGQSCKWAYVSGMCCNMWEVEFRTGYAELDSSKCMKYAVSAWNEAPRGESYNKRIKQLEVVRDAAKTVCDLTSYNAEAGRLLPAHIDYFEALEKALQALEEE